MPEGEKIDFLIRTYLALKRSKNACIDSVCGLALDDLSYAIDELNKYIEAEWGPEKAAEIARLSTLQQ